MYLVDPLEAWYFCGTNRCKGKYLLTVYTASDRMTAIYVRANRGTILVVALYRYMPVDYGDADSIDDYMAESGTLEGL